MYKEERVVAIIDPSPTPQELQNLAGVFSQTEAALKVYLGTPAGQKDGDFNSLTAAAISLNNAADAIANMQLHLATAQGTKAAQVINDAAASLQHDLIV